MVRPTGVARRWGTWNPGYPTALCDVASGLQIRLAAYSGRERRVVEFAGSAGATLGPHTLDAGYVDVGLDVAGSRLRLEFAKLDPHTVVGRVRCEHAEELRLRLWSLLAVEVDPAAGHVDDATIEPPPVRPATPGGEPLVVRARARSEHLALRIDPEPSVCDGYGDAAEAFADLERDGYFPVPSRSLETPGAVVARVNHEVAPEWRFAVSLATDPGAADAAAARALARADALVDEASARAAAPTQGAEAARGAEAASTGTVAAAEAAEAQAAVRDVLAWNTFWDPANARVYTGLSRSWAAGKFGGWLVWQQDVLCNALLAAALGDAELCEANLAAVLHASQPAGNLPCLVSGRTEWVDRAHPPLAAWIVWTCAARLGDRSLGARHLEALLASHRWWQAHRAVEDGLLTYGTSPTGRGLYVGSDFAARNEAAMDNSPMFDGARMRDDLPVLDMVEVGLNALHILDGEVLADLTRQAGRGQEAEALEAEAARRAEAVRAHLWDPDRKVFAGRRRDGGFVESRTPTSFYPLLSGLADDAQVRALIDDHLTDVQAFWGAAGIPAHALSEPATAEPAYWRGRVWAPHSFLVHAGLRRMGAGALAAEVARRAWVLFRGPWRASRQAFEHYALTADGDHQGTDVDDFYTWAALLPLLVMSEVGDVTLWDGLRLGPGSGEVFLDGRRWHVTAGTAAPSLRADLPDGSRLTIDGVAHVTRVRADDRLVSVTVPAARGEVRLCLDAFAGVIAAVLVDGEPQPEAAAGGACVTVPAGAEPATVDWVRR